MSKFTRVLAVVALIFGATAFAVMPGPAMAQHHGWHGGYHGGGHWRGGGYGWRGGGFGPGFGWGWGWGNPYYDYGPDYYAEPACGWVRVRVRSHGHWVLRRAWRCW